MSLVSSIKRIVLILLIVAGIITMSYFLFIRSFILQMGVASEEVDMSLPGDELVLSPDMKYMQAITIDAPEEIIWKYLIQVGYKRAGWYNLDFINRMTADDYFYENNRSAERIIPELQDLKEGDRIYLNPGLSLDVREIKDNEYMLLSANEGDKVLVSWVFNIKEVEQDKTRLYVRWRSNLGESFILRLVNLLFIEPASAVQQSQMFKGIKVRAERDFQQ